MDDKSTFHDIITENAAAPEPLIQSEWVVDPALPEPTAEFVPADLSAPPPIAAPPVPAASTWRRIGVEVLSGVQTLFSAAVYATLIVTFCFQVARVDGLSMAPTLQDHDRLIVNKLVYQLGEPRPGD